MRKSRRRHFGTATKPPDAMTQPNPTPTPFNHESTDTENLENHLGTALGYQETFRDHAAQIASRTWRSFNFNLGVFD